MDDDDSLSFTSFALLILLLAIVILFICHYFGPRTTSWIFRSNKEEKIGLSKHKLFHANGYMLPSGSEFLLATAGSFKRFDTPDKDKEDVNKGVQKHPPTTATTPLWNLPQTDNVIPPQPLRPAPAAPENGVKSLTYSFQRLDEIGTATNNETDTYSSDEGKAIFSRDYSSSARVNGYLNHHNHHPSALRTSFKNGTTIPQLINGPPPPRLSSSVSATLNCATAIPRPLGRRQRSMQNGMMHDANYSMYRQNSELADMSHNARAQQRLKQQYLTRRNSSTNPFLCDSIEDPANIQNNELDGSVVTINGGIGALNPFSESTSALASKNSESLSEIHTTQANSFQSLNGLKDHLASAAELRHSLANKASNMTTNPFAGLAHKVKRPHLLQKTISEDFLFRKLGANPSNASNNNLHGGGGGGSTNCNGNGTWSFSHSLLRQDSILSLGRRNSSESSFDGGANSFENIGKAISCESVASESSLFITDLDQPYTQITGYLCIGINYDKNTITEEAMQLSVTVVEAKGLICPFTVQSLDTFVRIYLVPDQAGATETKIVENSETPQYNETFEFWLKRKLKRHSLWFHLYHNGVAHTLIGEAEMEIGDMPRPTTTWIPLSDSRKFNAQWGEVMFSLSYLPTAERLTIVIVKARNLKLDIEASEEKAEDEEIQQIFTKVYLLDNEKKILKKRTSFKRKDRCPVFNESMIFSVPPHGLATIQLRFTVFGVTNNNRLLALGHVIVGSCATGKGLRHFHQMLSSLRKPVAMWHVLKRASNQPVFTGGQEAVVAAMQNTALRMKRNSVF